MSGFESVVEEAAIEYLGELGYDYLHGPEIAPDGANPERAAYNDVVLAGRLRAALARINPHLEADTIDEVAKRILRPESPSLEENNVAFQTQLARGIEVQVRKDGRIRGDQAWLFDFADPDNNDWLVVNQFTVVNGQVQPPPRPGGLRQRDAHRGHRVEEPRGRERHGQVGVEPAPDLQEPDPGPVRHQRDPGHLRRHRGQGRAA